MPHFMYNGRGSSFIEMYFTFGDLCSRESGGAVQSDSGVGGRFEEIGGLFAELFPLPSSDNLSSAFDNLSN